MHNSDHGTIDPQPDAREWARARTRRDFLRAAGLGGAALTLAACGGEGAAFLAPRETTLVTAASSHGVVLDFSTDVGVLNYAFALEQLEAAFYIQALLTPYDGITPEENRVLTAVRDHEIAHRDFFEAALGASGIGAVVPNFELINFDDRTSVLGTAQVFEDLGVGAYNGAARYLASSANLTVAGKIVSVEARHASAIRDLVAPRTGAFAPDAFDPALAPNDVLTAAGPFIDTPITIINA